MNGKTRRIDTLWSHIHWLGVLSTAGSYTAAALRLGVSKAAVSQRIGELEAAAGVPLVRRTTRSVRLTEAGQRLVDASRGSFDEIERSFEDARAQSTAPRGLLRVTAPVALARQAIAPLVPRFLIENPDVRLELDLSDRLVSLVHEGFDLAIRHSDEAADTQVAWSLCPTRSILVASPDYLRRRGEPAHPDELAAHNCLHYLRHGAPPAWTLDNGRSGDDAPVSVPARGSFAANNSEVLREAAAGGLGIAMLPDFSACSGLRDGSLRPVLPDWRVVDGFPNQLLAIRPHTAQVPLAVRAFVGFLREAFAGGFDVAEERPDLD